MPATCSKRNSIRAFIGDLSLDRCRKCARLNIWNGDLKSVVRIFQGSTDTDFSVSFQTNAPGIINFAAAVLTVD